MKKYLVILIILCSCASGTKRMQKIEVHGHRGARMVRPENTLPAFDYALMVGVDVLEFDLAVTKDNHVIISHDPFINRDICIGLNHLKGKVPYRSLTLAQVKKLDCGSKINPRFPRQKTFKGTQIPTLDEVFTMVKNSKHAAASRVAFNIETKIFPQYPEVTPTPAEFSKIVFDIIKKHGMEDRVILQSFDHRTLIEMRKLSRKVSLAQLTYENYFNFEDALSVMGVHYHSPNQNWINKEAVDRLHKHGIKVVPWTANNKAEWQRLVDMGVDGIISDDPQALIAWLKSKGLR